MHGFVMTCSVRSRKRLSAAVHWTLDVLILFLVFVDRAFAGDRVGLANRWGGRCVALAHMEGGTRLRERT